MDNNLHDVVDVWEMPLAQKFCPVLFAPLNDRGLPFGGGLTTLRPERKKDMKRISYFEKTVIPTLVAILFLTNLACVKRIPTQPDKPEIKSYMNIVYVHLKPGKEYLGKSVLTLKNPKLQDEYLIGERRNKEINIPRDDIDLIEVQRFDAKKTVIVSLAFITLGALVTAIGYGIGQANVD